MSRIRTTYSGLIYFAAQIISYLIGYIYPIYVARLLPKYEYGLYGFIISLLGLSVIFGTAVPFWAGRMIARGRNYIKTAIASNTIISIPIALIFTAIILITTPISQEYIIYIASFVILYIPLNYLLITLRQYILMRKTEKLGHELLISSVIKITIGLLLVFLLKIYGALATHIIILTITSIYFIALAIKEMEKIIDFNIVKEWLKGSWYNIINQAGYQLYINIPILVMGYLGEFISLSSYNVAVKVASWIGLTKGLTIAILPKLLAETESSGEEETIYRSFNLMLMFATPMLIGILFLNKEIVYVFGVSKYIDAAIPLAILGVASYLTTYAMFGNRLLVATEKFDKEFKIDIGRLVKSGLINIPIMWYLSLIILIILIILLLPQYGIVGLALASLGAAIFQFLYMFKIILYKFIDRRILTKLGKYLLSSIIMIIIIYPIPKPRSLIIAGTIFLGLTIYFTILYIIDKDFKTLLHKGIDEITRILREIM